MISDKYGSFAIYKISDIKKRCIWMRIVVPEKDAKSSQQAQNHWSLQTRIFLNVCSVVANKVDGDTREEFADWI